MTLRQRLVGTLVLTAAPLIGGLVWVRQELGRRAGEQALGQFVVARVDEIGQERCEAAPERVGRPPFAGRPFGARRLPEPPIEGGRPRRFGRHLGPIEMWAYDGAFAPSARGAPAFPEGLRATLQAGAEVATGRRATPEGPALEVAVRTGWADGGCAYVLGRLPEPRDGPLELALVAPALLLCGALLVAVWAAAGPVVRRIRELTVAVRRSAADRYATAVPVAGSDEVAQLARAFNDAGTEVRSHLTRVEEREQTLRSFLANTTHDVMLPLTVLQGHLAELRRGLETHGRVETERLAAALEEAHYMASLVHNLGAVAKLETGEPLLQRGQLDLGRLVERVVERHRPVARNRGIEIEHAVAPETPVLVDGDMTLIEQAVSNVVHNAVRYNRRGGHVALVLETWHREDGPGFRLKIADDGPGVPDDQLARLSERRFRGDEARRRHPEGLGLGLHIVRDVAERHGFELRFGRSEHGGLEVELTGPVIPPAGANSPAGSSDR